MDCETRSGYRSEEYACAVRERTIGRVFNTQNESVGTRNIWMTNS